LFCVLLNPIEGLPFTTLIGGDLLSSMSGIVPAVCEGRLDAESLTVESSGQRINADWGILARFCDIPHLFTLLISNCKSLKIPVPL
jgi:hypothetical protein